MKTLIAIPCLIIVGIVVLGFSVIVAVELWEWMDNKLGGLWTVGIVFSLAVIGLIWAST
jgi:hypothetical protein